MTRLWTVGTGARPLAEFLAILRRHRIALVADVRRFPTSRLAHFRGEALARALEAEGIVYAHLPELGGFREGGYEAYMTSEAFARGLRRLLALASERRVAVMCAEHDWRRCHRRRIAEALEGLGCEVAHIVGEGEAEGPAGRRERPLGAFG